MGCTCEKAAADVALVASLKRSQCGKRKRIKGIDFVKNMHKMLLSRVVAHAHAYLLHPIGACGLTKKKLITEFARHLSRKTCESKN